MEYSEKVIDHYTNPRNVGKIENASGVGEVGNPVCGDIMKMFLEINDSEIITDVKFKGEVDDEVIEDILKCLTNVVSVDMEKFSENEFEFTNVNPLLEGIITKVEEE